MGKKDKPKGRGGSLLALGFANIVDNQEGGLINSLFPIIRDALGMSISALGIFSSISKFARMIFGPLWSILADRYGRKKVLFFITGVWGIWTIFAGLAQSYQQYLILYTLGCVGTVASEPISNAIVSDMYKSGERSKAFGTLRFITTYAGIVITPIIAQLARIENGWRIGMFIMGGCSVISGLLILFLLKEPEKEKETPIEKKFEWKKVPDLFKIPTFRLLGGTQIFVTSVALTAFMITFMVDVRGFETATANLVMMPFGLGIGISSLLGGFLGDWAEKKNPERGRIYLMQIYLVVFAILTFLALGIEWSVTGYLIIWGLVGLVYSIGFIGAVFPMVSNVIPHELSGTAFGILFSLVQGLFTALFSLGIGFLAERFGLGSAMIWVIPLPYLLNAVYWFLFYKPYPKDVAAAKGQ